MTVQEIDRVLGAALEIDEIKAQGRLRKQRRLKIIHTIS